MREVRGEEEELGKGGRRKVPGRGEKGKVGGKLTSINTQSSTIATNGLNSISTLTSTVVFPLKNEGVLYPRQQRYGVL